MSADSPYTTATSVYALDIPTPYPSTSLLEAGQAAGKMGVQITSQTTRPGFATLHFRATSRAAALVIAGTIPGSDRPGATLSVGMGAHRTVIAES